MNSNKKKGRHTETRSRNQLIQVTAEDVQNQNLKNFQMSVSEKEGKNFSKDFKFKHQIEDSTPKSANTSPSCGGNQIPLTADIFF